MIGTEDGFWFAIQRLPDKRVDYEFYRAGDLVESGVCQAPEMYIRFDLLRAAARTLH